ncbi:MAG: 2-oxo acid dehydrogenase subunit E2 [Polyangiaceae bacterium]|nr:2-oxo acid dehydrogenase subunit E2 [Polyangiaceae bacterium]
MAVFEFKLPDIGEGVSEGEIVSWLVKVGDQIAADDDLVEVMTDKATVTIPAPEAGTVTALMGEEGDTIPVGGVMAVFETEGAAEASPNTIPSDTIIAKAPSEALGGAAASAVGDIKDVLPGVVTTVAVSRTIQSEKPLAAPATRKLARELDVDLRMVLPSGPGGRVTADDVKLYSAGGGTRVPDGPSPIDVVTLRPSPAPRAIPAPHQKPAAPVPSGPADKRLPIRGLRKRIFENMARSTRTAAHFTYVEECECTKLIAARTAAKPIAQAEGVKLTYLPYIVKAVVAALRQNPALNCLVDDHAQEMIMKGSFDLGIAASTDAGLTVPVLRGADALSIIEIASELERLATEAKAGKTKREDIGGSSFTITSLGKLGGLFATPVVNYPEVAILGIHEMKKTPIVRDDEIVIGHVMCLSLSFDHRIIDGHVGAAFAQDVVGFLQEPDRLMLHMR